MSNLLENKCVASFGDGTGFYKDTMASLEQVSCYDAFDGAPFVNETSQGKVSSL
jgi:hypothetical protein